MLLMGHERIITGPETSMEVVVPDFVSDVLAVDRARRLARGEILRLRMEPEFGCVLPLWDEGGPVVDMRSDQLEPSLRVELERWQQHWESAFVFPDGWVSEDEHASWSAEGESIFQRLEAALWLKYEVVAGFRRMAYTKPPVMFGGFS